MTRPPLLGAKLRQPGTVGAEGLSAAATRSEPLTGKGTLLGTVQYMAPEQLEGQEADARTDIFAFGAVVYEMVTGSRAFEGETQASLVLNQVRFYVNKGEKPVVQVVRQESRTPTERLFR